MSPVERERGPGERSWRWECGRRGCHGDVYVSAPPLLNFACSWPWHSCQPEAGSPLGKSSSLEALRAENSGPGFCCLGDPTDDRCRHPTYALGSAHGRRGRLAVMALVWKLHGGVWNFIGLWPEPVLVLVPTGARARAPEWPSESQLCPQASRLFWGHADAGAAEGVTRPRAERASRSEAPGDRSC